MSGLRTRVTIDGLRIFGRRLPGEHGLFLGPDGIKGWDDGAEVRRDVVQRQYGHGDFAAPAFRGSRMVTLSGWAAMRSPAELDRLGDRVMGLLADGDLTRLTVARERTQWATVGLFGTPTFASRRADRSRADWQVQLWAPDPWKFGDLHRTAPIAGGRDLEVFHYGNAPAAQTLIVQSDSGMSGGYTVEGPGGRRYRVSSAGTGGGFIHRIDMVSGMLRTNSGAALFGLTTIGDTWTVPPAAKTTCRLVPSGGTGTLISEVRNTYV